LSQEEAHPSGSKTCKRICDIGSYSHLFDDRLEGLDLLLPLLAVLGMEGTSIGVCLERGTFIPCGTYADKAEAGVLGELLYLLGV